MQGNESTRLVCSILAMDQSCFSYKVCRFCETPVPDDTPAEFICKNRKCAGRRRSSKRLFRLLFSIGTETRVMNVVAFDRAAQVIFGCSAQEFFDFSILHPCAALGVLSNHGVCLLVHNTVKIASKVLVGELLKVTLNTPKRGKAEHLRMTNIVPMSSDFEPVIETLKKVDWS
ncbi:hypothetical protein ES332_A11G008000v1 [Gossypium tomentosum]|uniref:Replication factor A C-terminal domain-containing protein n=1 Tax=Gossypium tomentosum TaxID=34277 RepID=A0A5D2N587_GOSTO|nr:hypothetical protein ES332_A11G008000v1 [Gossypium tomentosum]